MRLSAILSMLARKPNGQKQRPENEMRHILTITTALLGAVCLAACATAAKYTLNDRFQAIGIPTDVTTCMVDDLEERLSSEDLQDLARYTLSVSRADTTRAAIGELMKIDNPRAVTAIGRAGFSCVTGFGR